LQKDPQLNGSEIKGGKQIDMDIIGHVDPEVTITIAQELERQSLTLEMIASARRY
jgi:hypothetical protein